MNKWLLHNMYSRNYFYMLRNGYLIYESFIILKSFRINGKK